MYIMSYYHHKFLMHLLFLEMSKVSALVYSVAKYGGFFIKKLWIHTRKFSKVNFLIWITECLSFYKEKLPPNWTMQFLYRSSFCLKIIFFMILLKFIKINIFVPLWKLMTWHREKVFFFFIAIIFGLDSCEVVELRQFPLRCSVVVKRLRHTLYHYPCTVVTYTQYTQSLNQILK